MTKAWYSPSGIKFWPEHIEWIIEYYEVLIDGRWPQKHSGYIDNPFAPGGHIRAGAYFESPMDILAEFHWRIEQCGSDGEAFRCIRCEKYDEKSICKLLNIQPVQIDRILKQVFSFIMGRRKDRSYSEFIRH